MRFLPDPPIRPVLAVVSFLCLYLSSGSLQRVHAQTPGTVDPVFGGASLGLLGNVQTLVLQPDGKVLVGGYFTGCIARLNADGTLDTSFNASTVTISDFLSYSEVDALALQPDGKILLGGFFSQGIEGESE